MTLRDDDDLGQALEALTGLRLALASLRRDVGTLNTRNFGVMAEGTLDEIARIESEVNTYLGLDDARAQLWMRVVGPGIEVTDAPAAVMTSVLDTLRKGLQAATEHALTGTLSARPTARVQAAVDVRVAALAQGSLRIGLNIDAGRADVAPDVAQAARTSVDEYLAVAGWAGTQSAGSAQADAELAAVIPDDGRRRLLLNLVMQLAPRARGAVERLELSGRLLTGRSTTLSRASRERIGEAIDRIEQAVSVATHEGALRELDLDKRSATVRNPDEPDIPCEIAEELMTTAHEALGRQVRVVGSRTGSTGRQRTTLFVTRLEILDDTAPDD